MEGEKKDIPWGIITGWIVLGMMAVLAGYFLLDDAWKIIAFAAAGLFFLLAWFTYHRALVFSRPRFPY